VNVFHLDLGIVYKKLGLEPKRSRLGRSSDRNPNLAIAGSEEGSSPPGHTDIYEKIGRVLKLPSSELSKLADLQRNEELRKGGRTTAASIQRVSRVDSAHM
jgi:hypothetical protein